MSPTRETGPRLGDLNPRAQQWLMDLRTSYKHAWRAGGKTLPVFPWVPRTQMQDYHIGAECKFYLANHPGLTGTERHMLSLLS